MRVMVAINHTYAHHATDLAARVRSLLQFAAHKTTAAQPSMSAFGPSRHFAAMQHFRRFRSKADIQRAALTEPDL